VSALRFQLGDLLRERRLRDENLARRPREAALLGQGEEVSQLPKIHTPSL
jgi:hypothetical protein